MVDTRSLHASEFWLQIVLVVSVQHSICPAELRVRRQVLSIMSMRHDGEICARMSCRRSSTTERGTDDIRPDARRSAEHVPATDLMVISCQQRGSRGDSP